MQFKNYTNRTFQFNRKVTGICGKNGTGKTNLLDAIHYLCFTKSYFSNTDSVNVQQGASGFRIEGHFATGTQADKVVCILRETGKKDFLVNDEAYDKFSKHIGRYPCVVIAPDDSILITGGSEGRRNFLDALLSQLDAEYLKNLISYNKILQQRNSFLKTAAETNQLDESLLQIFNTQLLPPGNYIFEKRKNFLVSFLPKVKRLYNAIASVEENLSIVYDSRLLESPFEDLLSASKNKDLLLQRTTAGIHRDELVIQLRGQPFKNIASQGQRKSILFALKLTELEELAAKSRNTPLLLLDDIFEKLDEDRIASLIYKVCKDYNGQVFITDTNAERLSKHLSSIQAEFELIEI